MNIIGTCVGLYSIDHRSSEMMFRMHIKVAAVGVDEFLNIVYSPDAPLWKHKKRIYQVYGKVTP